MPRERWTLEAWCLRFQCGPGVLGYLELSYTLAIIQLYPACFLSTRVGFKSDGLISLAGDVLRRASIQAVVCMVLPTALI